MGRENIFKVKARENFSEIQRRCRKGLEGNRQRWDTKPVGGSHEKGQFVKEGHGEEEKKALCDK